MIPSIGIQLSFATLSPVQAGVVSAIVAASLTGLVAFAIHVYLRSTTPIARQPLSGLSNENLTGKRHQVGIPRTGKQPAGVPRAESKSTLSLPPRRDKPSIPEPRSKTPPDDGTVERLNAQIVDQQQQIADLEQALEKKVADVDIPSDQQWQIDQLNQENVGLQVRLDELYSQFEKLETQKREIELHRQESEAKYNAADESVSQMRGFLAQQEANVASLEREKIDFVSHINDLKQRLGSSDLISIDSSMNERLEQRARQEAESAFDQERQENQRRIDELEQRIAELSDAENQVRSLESSLTERESLIASLEVRIDEARNVEQTDADNIDGFKQIISEQQAALDEAQVELQTAQAELQNTRSELQNTFNQFSQVEQQKNEAFSELQDANHHKEQLAQALERQIAKQDQLAAQSADHEALSRRIAELETSLEQADADKKAAEFQVSAMATDLVVMSSVETQLTDLRGKHDNLKAEHQKLNDANEGLLAEAVVLREQLHQQASLQASIEEQRQNNEAYVAKNSSLQQQLDETAEQIHHLQDRLVEAEQSRSAAATESAQLTSSLHDLTADREQFAQQLTELQTQLVEAETLRANEEQQTASQIQELNEQFDTERRQLQSRLDSLQSELDNLQLENEQAVAAHRRFAEEAEANELTLQSQIDNLRLENEQAVATHHRIAEEAEAKELALQSQIDNLRLENEQAVAAQQRFTKEAEANELTLQSQIDNLRLENEQAVVAQQRLAEEAKTNEMMLQSHIDELRQERTQLELEKQSIESARDENFARITAFEEQSSAFEEQMSELSTRLQAVSTERDEISSANHELDTQIEALKQELDATIQRGETRAMQLEEQLAAASAQWTGESESFNAQFAQVTAQKHAAESSRDEANLRIETLEQQLAATEGFKEEWARQKDALNSQIEELTEQKQQYESESEERASQIADLEEQLANISNEMQAWTEQAESTTAKIGELTAQKDDAVTMADAKSTQVVQLEAELTNLRHDLESAKAVASEQQNTEYQSLLTQIEQTQSESNLQIEKLESQLRELELHKQQAEQKVTEMVSDMALLSSSDGELEQLRSRIAELESEKKQAQVASFASQTQASELTQQIDDINEYKNRVTKERDALQRRIDELIARQKTDQETDSIADALALSDAEQRLEDLYHQVAELKQTNEQLGKSLRESEEKLVALKADVTTRDTVGRENEFRLQQQLDDARLQLDQLNAVCMRSQGEIEAAKHAVDQKAKEITQLHAEMTQSEEIQQRLTVQISALKDNEQRLKESLLEVAQDDDAIALLRSQFESAQQELQQMRQLLDETQSQRNQLKTAVEESQQQILEMRQAIEEHTQNEIDSTKNAEDSQLQTDLTQQREENAELETRIDGLIRALNEARSAHQKASQQVRELDQATDLLAQEKESLSTQLQQQAEELSKAKELAKADASDSVGVQLSDQVLQLQGLVDDQNERLKLADTQTEQLKKKLAESDEEQELLVVELRNLRSEKERTSGTDSEASEDVDELSTRIKKTELESAELREKLFKQSEVANSWRKERSELLDRIEELQLHVSKLEGGTFSVKDLEKLTKEKDKLDKNLARVQSEADKRSEQLQSVTSSLSDARRELTTLKSDLKEAQAILRNHNAVVQDSVAKAVKKKRSQPSRAKGTAKKETVNDVAADGKAPNPSKQRKAKTEKADEKLGDVNKTEPSDKDNLQEINGLGPTFEKRLHKLGIFYYRQIAKWNAKTIENISAEINSGDRIENEDWVKQAAKLAKKK